MDMEPVAYQPYRKNVSVYPNSVFAITQWNDYPT